MKAFLTLFLIAIFASQTTVATFAQQTAPSDEAKIQQLRNNIRRLKENAPPSGSPDATDHLNTRSTLQRQLRDLLIENRGAVKSRIANLEVPDATPEVLSLVEKFKTRLKTINDEVDGIDKELGQAIGRVTPQIVSASPTPTPSQENPEVTDQRNKFLEAVRKVSADDLRLAAAPAEVAEVKAVVPCNDSGRPALLNNFSQLDENVCKLAQKVIDEDRSVLIARDLSELFVILTAQLLKTKTENGESYAAFVTEAQEIRTDQQMGAGPSSSGTTSLVSKGGLPYLFGFAVENGAATQTQSDTTVTFRFNPGGVINMFQNKGFITAARDNDSITRFLNKTSVGFSFDTSRGDEPGIFTGDRQQLSAISARVEFVNERDPRHKKYEAAWEKLAGNEGVKLAQQVWSTTAAMVDLGGNRRAFSDPALQAWFVQLNEKVAELRTTVTGTKEQKINAIADAIREQAALIPVDLVTQDTITALTDFAKEDRTYSAAKDSLLDSIAKGRIFTVEYLNKREVNAPDTSNFTFIAATGAGGRVNLTANGSFTFFHQRPEPALLTDPRPNRIRDFQFAGELDIPFKLGGSQFDFWFSGRYERLLTDASNAAGVVVPGTRGDIALGQFGLNIPIESLGMKFPVSVTFANRTELIKEKVVRGHFGFTFNWDTLWSKVKPF
jgi:hypothetical protein